MKSRLIYGRWIYNFRLSFRFYKMLHMGTAMNGSYSWVGFEIKMNRT